MPRDLPLSNGHLLVMFDRQYRIRDIYYPQVGKENHDTGHAFRSCGQPPALTGRHSESHAAASGT